MFITPRDPLIIFRSLGAKCIATGSMVRQQRHCAPTGALGMKALPVYRHLALWAKWAFGPNDSWDLSRQLRFRSLLRASEVSLKSLRSTFVKQQFQLDL